MIKTCNQLFFLGTMLALLAMPVSAATLTIGSISDEPTKELKLFLPVINYLAARLQTAGVEKGDAIVARSIEHMAQLIRDGRVDLYIDSPFPTLEISQLSGSRPLLRRWKKGIGSYHSIVFARKDSGIKSATDLRGKTIAFEEPFSTSSYFLPKTSLRKLGLKLVAVSDPKTPVDSDHVGYLFSDDDENTLVWVLRKRVQAGAMSFPSFKNLPEKLIKKLTIVHSTIEVPRHIVSFRSDLDPALILRIKDVLLQMHESEDGSQILKQFKKTARFDEFPGGVDLALEPLRELSIYIGKNNAK